MKDYKGNKYGKLTLLHPIGPGGGDRGHLWMAACECGNTRQVVGKDVAAGRLRSCGKCPKGMTKQRGGYRARSAEESRLRKLLARTASKALKENTKFALTYNDFHDISLAFCSICHSATTIQSLSIEFVDSLQGYTVNNITVICRDCKRHMAGSNLAEYVGYLRKTQHLFK